MRVVLRLFEVVRVLRLFEVFEGVVFEGCFEVVLRLFEGYFENCFECCFCFEVVLRLFLSLF